MPYPLTAILPPHVVERTSREMMMDELAILLTLIAAIATWRILASRHGVFRWIWFAVCLGFSVVAFLLEPRVGESSPGGDPSAFVLDEIAGLALTFLFIPADVRKLPFGSAASLLVAAFLAFRLFDGLKPGIGWIETVGWPGAIVWDDLAAGVSAGIVALLISRIWIKLADY